MPVAICEFHPDSKIVAGVFISLEMSHHGGSMNSKLISELCNGESRQSSGD